MIKMGGVESCACFTGDVITTRNRAFVHNFQHFSNFDPAEKSAFSRFAGRFFFVI